MATGARVSNAYATYPVLGDNPEKFGLIPHNDMEWHHFIFKVPTVQAGTLNFTMKSLILAQDER